MWLGGPSVLNRVLEDECCQADGPCSLCSALRFVYSHLPKLSDLLAVAWVVQSNDQGEELENGGDQQVAQGGR